MSSRMPKNTSSSSGVRSSISKRLRSPIGSMLWRTSVMVDGIGSRARERGYLSRRLLSGLAVALLRGLAGRAERRGEDRPGDALSSRAGDGAEDRSEEHTSELQSLMRNSYAVFCLKKKKKPPK